MRIQHFQMDRSEGLGPLSFSCSPGLNVIHGSSGTAIQYVRRFLRTKLWGNHEERIDGWWSHSEPELPGTLTVEDRGDIRAWSAAMPHTRYGSDGVFPNISEYRVDWTAPPASSRGVLDLDHLARVFAPISSASSYAESLVHAAEAVGVSLRDQPDPSWHVSELRMRADECRRQLNRLPYRGRDLQGLLDRQRILQQRLSALQSDHQRNHLHRQVDFQDLTRQVQGAESEIARIRAEWRRLDDIVSDRRRHLEEIREQAEEKRRSYLAKRRADLSVIEANLARGRDMILDIQNRREELVGELDQHDLSRRTLSSRRDREALCVVESLARQLDELGGLHRDQPAAPFGLYNVQEPYRRSQRVVSQKHLDDLRAEVGRLCRSLQDRRGEEHFHILEDEADHLDQSESMLQRWIDILTRQRDQLAEEIREIEARGAALVGTLAACAGPYLSLNPTNSYLGEYLDDYGRVVPGRLQAVAHSCDRVQALHPDDDERLHTDMLQRDTAQRNLEAAERRLRQLLDNRRTLEGRDRYGASNEIESVRQELVDVEKWIRAAEDRERLQRELNRWEMELSARQTDVRPNHVLHQASSVLRRMSMGRLHRIVVTGNGGISVESSSGTSHLLTSLSRAEIQFVDLSLRLAIVESLRIQGESRPLFLDEERLSDIRDSIPVAEELVAHARAGNQILLFTSSSWLAAQLGNLGAHVLWIPARSEAAQPMRTTESGTQVDRVRFRPQNVIPEPGARSQVSRFDSRAAYPVYRDTYHTDSGQPSASNGGREIRPARDSRASAVPHGSSLVSAGVVPREVADRLASRGIQTISDFLSSSAETVERALASWGVSTGQIRSWQKELALCCAIPEVSPWDARILVRCGVASPEELANANENGLWQELQQTARTSPHLGRYVASSIAREHLGRWIQSAQAYVTGVQHRPSGTDRVVNRRTMSGDYEGITFTSRNRRSRQMARRRKKSESTATPSIDRRRPLTRRDRRRHEGERLHPGRPRRERIATPAPGEHRFHLGQGDSVVEAPSIGTRTAERLTNANVRTVRDLLQAHPADVVRALGSRRITEQVIRDWQAQAQLVCRVPELRGHDAQVLVACGIRDADQLAQSTPEQLWEVIQPFTTTAECQRIIRGGQLPDKNEVADWVRYSQLARPLQAA